MPTYDYECRSCAHRFEQFQSMTAKELRQCPECGKKTLQRLIGAGAGVIFKGSGFYSTDYRGPAYDKARKDDAGGGCAPACGTDAAPPGCKMGKQGGKTPD
jgi:putative FmdB family regulatory protein